MSKRRKILINNLEVSVEEDAEILEYIDANQSYQIADENHEAQFICTTGEQFTMEDGTIVQYIEPEYSMEEDEILQDHDQVNEEVNDFENLSDESMKYSYIIINGEREGSYFLYCNKQLYKKNRSKYYRCRLFPNCTGSGKIYDDKMFHLQQPHGDHPDQESYKESLELFNTLRGRSKDNANNFNIIYEEEGSKQESPQVGDDTKNEFLETKILKRNRDAFKILTELLGDQDYENINDSDRPLNNYEKTEINSIDGLGIRTKIIYSAGHIYLHTNTSTYRCYLYPKCLAAGNLVTEQSVSLFQLNVPHSDHGFKDTERDILHFVVAVKKRVQVNPNNMSHIFNEELQKDNYAYLKDKISLDTLIRLFVRLGSYPHDDNEVLQDKAKIGSDEDSYLEVPRAFSIIDGGSGGHVLFCDGQLYNSNNRAGYYRCRLYQSGCPATGIRENKTFILMKSHLGHANQVTEKIKLQLTSALRRRAATESLPLQTIYNQEMRNPEFKLVSHLLPYHAVYKNMKRARTHGLSSDKLDTSDNNEKSKQKDKSEKIIENSSDTTKSKNENNESKTSMKFTEVNADSVDEDLTNIGPKTNNYRSNKVKNPQFPCMKYSLMEGERLGSCILYCNEQLYTLNRNNYYRCRMYPQGCQATGMREENYFRLCRGHSGHGSQEPERRRIILINTIKKKTMTNPDPDYFESVFNRECEKPEYADIVERVSFTVILNNMRKIWKRYQQQDPTLTRNIMRNDMPEDLHQKMTERESKDLQSDLQDETEDFKMAVEIGDDIYCDQDVSPKPYTLMEGERLGSCLLYSNQQLYTNNQRNYYRCRMYSVGCRATGIIKDNLFYLLKPHNSHGSQEREVRRLVLITRIKRRAQIDPSRLQTIFNEECSKQEFNDVAEMVNFKKIYSTLDRCRRRAANDVLEVIEPKIPPDITIAEKESSLKDQWTTDISGEQTEHMTEDGVKYFIQNVEAAFQENSENEIINPDESYLVENNNVAEAIDASEHEQQMTQEELITQLGLADSGGEENVYENGSGASEEIAQQGENYEFIGGDRFGSKLLYSEGQLYCLNRDNYFRCRIYPNCIATGRVYGDQFRLHRGHSIHDLQVDEKARLLFINNLKKRVQEDLTTPIKQIYDDECSKPENNSVAFLVNYKTVFSTLMKCRTRAQISPDKEICADQLQSSDQLDVLHDYGTRFDNGLNKSNVNNDHDENLNPTWHLDEFSDSDVEDLVEVPKPDMNTPTKFVIIQGDRTGSLILYSNGHLYTRNRGSYYRCRLHPECYGSGNRRGNLFYMTRQHNNHPLQDDEKCRLALMNVLKRRVLQETTPLKVIYDEEIIKPEFSSIADLVSFKMIQSTMIKIRERVKYGQEPGTVMLSTEAVNLCSKSEIDDNESIENEEGVDSDADESEIKKKLEKESSEDRYIYYYVLDYDDTDDTEMENFSVNLGENVTREYLNSPNPKAGINEIPSTQPIVVYTVDIDFPEENIPSFERKVHLPDEELHEEISRTAVTSTQIEMQEPLSYKIIEDCLNEQYLLYAGKQLYSKKNNSFFGCRIRTCQAVGQIRDSSFYLLYNHINHPLQNKVKLQLQLIARIKSRSLERRTARVSKIFRHECTRPEFRTVANTITLDGISDMVRKYRRKYFPKMTNPPIEMISGSMLPDLPPPVEFSMVNGTTPDVRLLHCGDALFYHSSKGVYRCHVKACGSFGRRDRIFFQLLSPHIEHDAVDINDKDNLLLLIKQIEEDICRRNLMGDNENENNLHVENQKVADQEQEIQIPQIKFEIQADDAVEGHEEMQLDDIQKDNQDNFSNNSINQSSTKSILQQAWEELQVHI